MNIIQTLKAKLLGKKSFEENELVDMGPGKKPGRKKGTK